MKQVTIIGLALLALGIGLCGATAAPGEEGEASPWVSPGVPHPGSDQIFWVPTFAQAEEAARATGRLMMVIGSVSDWSGY